MNISSPLSIYYGAVWESPEHKPDWSTCDKYPYKRAVLPPSNSPSSPLPPTRKKSSFYWAINHHWPYRCWSNSSRRPIHMCDRSTGWWVTKLLRVRVKVTLTLTTLDSLFKFNDIWRSWRKIKAEAKLQKCAHASCCCPPHQHVSGCKCEEDRKYVFITGN